MSVLDRDWVRLLHRAGRLRPNCPRCRQSPL